MSDCRAMEEGMCQYQNQPVFAVGIICSNGASFLRMKAIEEPYSSSNGPSKIVADSFPLTQKGVAVRKEWEFLRPALSLAIHSSCSKKTKVEFLHAMHGSLTEKPRGFHLLIPHLCPKV